MIRTKLIAYDLDGTLLNSKKELTPHTKEVLEEAARQGIVILPATGRPVTGIPEMVLKITGTNYAVTANGARVMDLRRNEAIIETLLPRETGRKILKIFYEYDTLKEIYFNGKGYANEDDLLNIGHFLSDPHMAEYIVNTRTPVKDLEKIFDKEFSDMDKIHGIMANLEDIDKIRARLQEIPDIEITGALGCNLEINAKGATKGNALLKLGESLNISREEIMAFGDAANDHSMLKLAGTGVAMANADEETKAVADYVTGSNDEDGVARFIEDHVLN